ncbi:MAG: hypothetical protein IKO63_08065 [Paludibacteraceae bacterium]|nr:hypothetical protein [Paludibacteraceae bacterium]
MKRILYILLAIGASVLVTLTTGCNSRQNVKDADFSITVSNIQDRQVSITVEPAYADKYYYWDVLTCERFAELKDTIGEYYYHQWEFDLRYIYQGYPYDGDDEEPLEPGEEPWEEPEKIEDFLYKGTSREPEWDALAPETEYVAFAYYPDDNYHADKISVCTFKTAEGKIMNDVKIFFNPNKNKSPDKLSISPSLAVDYLFYCSCPSAELQRLNTSIERYAEDLFAKCISGEANMGDHCPGSCMVTVDYPAEPTEWCACLFAGKSRTTNWFSYHTPQ